MRSLFDSSARAALSVSCLLFVGSLVQPVVGGPGPPNDLCEDATPVAIPSLTPGTTLGATVDDVPFCGTTTNTAPGVWYSVTGTGNTITASTCGAVFEYDTKISVFCSCEALLCITGNDDECTDGASGLLSTASWCSQEGETYLILVHGFLANAGAFELTLSDDGVPCKGALPCVPPTPVGACCVCEGEQAVCTLETEEDCQLLGGAYLGDGSTCAVAESSFPNVPIPDGDSVGITDTIDSAVDVVITDLNVGLMINHTWTGDLCITLEHGGQTVQLVARPGADTGETCHSGGPFGCSFDNYNLILDDEGTGGAIEDLCSADMTSPPNYTPFEPLSAFDGMSAAGTWTITVSDNAVDDEGTLVGWSLLVSPNPAACCPADFNGNGSVGFADLTALLNNYGLCPTSGSCPWDLNGNGSVGFADLTQLLAAYGPCCPEEE